VFASKAWNPAGVDGLLMGNPDFLWKQVVAAVVSGLWAFGFTYGMLWLINKMTPVLIDEQTQETGLDQSCMAKKPTAGRCENRAFARQRPCCFFAGGGCWLVACRPGVAAYFSSATFTQHSACGFCHAKHFSILAGKPD
jgi:hypothetical protein